MASETRSRQLRSANYVNALVGTVREDIGEHPRDPVWFEYEGQRWRIFRYRNWARYDGSKYLDLRNFRGNKLQTVSDTDIFNLIPLGRIRQRMESGTMVDYFENPPELEKLYERLRGMIARKHKKLEWLDIDIRMPRL